MGCKYILNLLHLQRHLFFMVKSCVDVKLSPLPTWVHRSSSPVLVTIFLFRWILSVSIAFHESSSGFGAKGSTRVSTRVSTLPQPRANRRLRLTVVDAPRRMHRLPLQSPNEVVDFVVDGGQAQRQNRRGHFIVVEAGKALQFGFVSSFLHDDAWAMSKWTFSERRSQYFERELFNNNHQKL